MTASFSRAGSCPCSSPSRRPASSPVASRSRSSAAERAWIRSDSSTSGQTTYAWRPAPPRLRTRSQAPDSSSGPRAHRVVIGRSSRRQLVEHGRVQVAVDGHGRGARDRGGRHHQDVRHDLAGSFLPEGSPLLDAEAMLLVDHHRPQRPERHRLGQQGMGADQDVDRAVGQAGVQPGPLPGGGAVGEQRHPEGAVGQQGLLARQVDARQQGRSRRRDAARPAPRSEPSARPDGRPPRRVSSAATATTVLPDPTSPCSSRCIGCGPARSALISAMARSWAAGQGKGRPLRKRRTRSPSTWWRIPTASRSTARLRITRIIWSRSSSSKARRRRASWLSARESGA